jgi:putative glutamine amidotransferase
VSKPRIGLTTYRQRGQSGVWDTEIAFTPAFYIEAITRAGGLAVLLPPQNLELDDAKTILGGLDGLVVSGGRDVDARLYGAEPGPNSEAPDELRDRSESMLLKAAIELNFPFLGICRGAQLLNVVRGGNIIQHLPDQIGSNKYQLGNAVFNPIPVSVLEGTALYDIIGGGIDNAAMYHHQAINEPGEGLRVTARSEDGVIEAVELEGHPFGLAVQWHPEQTLEDLRLFQALVAKAKARAA